MNWAIKQAVLQQPQSNLNKLAMVAQAPGFSNGRQTAGPAFPQGYLPDQQPTQYQQAQKVIDPRQFNQVFNGQQPQTTAAGMPIYTQGQTSAGVSPITGAGPTQQAIDPARLQSYVATMQRLQPRPQVTAPAGLW